MRLIVNGIENGSNQVIRGADTTLNLVLCGDDGSPQDLTSPVVLTIELYPSQARDVTPSAVLTPTIGAGATAGVCTVTIEDTTTLVRGQYYASAVWKSNSGTGVGTLVRISGGFDSIAVV